jgi:NADPH:quinone reductase-like Zn-dependent oxidoreductase
LRKPKETRIGVDYAGVVEAVGKNVTQFKVGDEVFGGRAGSLAQYICAKADRGVAAKPPSVTFEEAGSVAVAAITALQGLRDHGHVEAGSKVLINGASGGVGTFAVQIAKALGAEVTGVCSTRNLELVKSLGADRVIDYTKEDFTKRDERYDVIIDNVGNRPLLRLKRALKQDGTLVAVAGGEGGRLLGGLTRKLRVRALDQVVQETLTTFQAAMRKDDILAVAELAAAGTLTPHIDRRYGLDQAAEAIRYVETHRARGKVVLLIAPEEGR